MLVLFIATTRAFTRTFIPYVIPVATYMSKNGVSPILVKKHMRHSNMKQTERYTDESQLDVSEALKHLPGHQDASAHISAQILGSEGQYETQPDARGDKPKNQKPLKTGAQVALCPIEAQKKLVEAVGIESNKANTQSRKPR